MLSAAAAVVTQGMSPEDVAALVKLYKAKRFVTVVFEFSGVETHTIEEVNAALPGRSTLRRLATECVEHNFGRPPAAGMKLFLLLSAGSEIPLPADKADDGSLATFCLTKSDRVLRVRVRDW